jgi:peptide-methionine (S)-S-oxide reductase
MEEFTALYPDLTDFVNSTAAARVNGYLGGYGTLADLQTEIDDWALSPETREMLLEIVMNRR